MPGGQTEDAPETAPDGTHTLHERAGALSLDDIHSSIPVPEANAGFFKQWRAFAGPALLISVGYMDPGNWGTDLQGGAQFKYGLLWVVALASLMAIFMQVLAARLGIVTGKDLAQACRDWYPKWTRYPNWISCEIAIGACDLAEVLGSAVALNLLFHIPIFWAALVQTRAVGKTKRDIATAIKFNTLDSAFALFIAFFINAAILVLAAMVFFGKTDIAVGGTTYLFNESTDWIRVAFLTLAPLLGTVTASTLFAVALLASGQSSTITGTIAGQVVMEGFTHWRVRPWVSTVCRVPSTT